MVKVIKNKIRFSSEGPFFLWDWDKSEQPYVRDFQGKIHFFIKDLKPKKVLEEIFINPMKRFAFNSGIEPIVEYKGSVVNSNFNYLFASFDFPRAPEFDWTKYSFPIKRDTKLNTLKEENEVMKYLSRYIDG